MENKGVIYILTNPSFPDYVKIGYADDIDKRLKQLNRSECIPFAFRVYATYEVNSRLSDLKLHSIIDKLNPDLRSIDDFNGQKRVREFYAMKPEEAFAILEAMAEIHDCKLSYLQEAANAVCGTIEDKKTFTTYASELNRLMKYTDRDDITGHTRKEYEAIAAIYAELQKKRKHINTTDLMVEINAIISSYVEIQHMPSMVREEPRRFDISAIDFDLLRREFAKVKKKNLVLKDLEEVIQQKLDRMMFCNPDRINYYERYQQIIDDYNSEQDRATIEKTFMDLMDLANQMNQEEQRYVREGFSSDEELSLQKLEILILHHCMTALSSVKN